MGRQSYLTRLALGRSPFEAPERDESGNFILGQNAHEFDNADLGYVQQFNERGHPENKASRAAARELRRAMNDVFSTMGIVMNKKKKQKKAESKKSEAQKLKSVIDENEYGLQLAALDLVLMFGSLWWLVSLRRRVMTIKAYSSVPFIEVVKAETRILGLPNFFFAGMPAWAISWCINTFRYCLIDEGVKMAMAYCQEQWPAGTRGLNIKRYFGVYACGLSTGLFLIAAPIQAFSLLQSLHLIPASAILSAKSLLSHIGLSTIDHRGLSRTTLKQATENAVSFLLSPLFLAWGYDFLRHYLESAIYRIFRRTTPKPDEPDEVSTQAAIERHLDDSQIPGLALTPYENSILVETPALHKQIMSEFNALFEWFRNTFRVSEWRFWTPESSLSFAAEGSLRIHCQQLQREYLRRWTRISGRPLTEGQRRQVQVAAITEAFRDRDLMTGPQNINEWILPDSDDVDTRSTATPEPEDFFNPEDISPPEAPAEQDAAINDQHARSGTLASPRNHEEEVEAETVMEPLSRANTLFSDVTRSPPPTPPSIRATIVHEDLGTVTMQLEEVDQTRNHEQRADAADPSSSSGGRDIAFEGAVQYVESPVRRTRAAITEAMLQLGDDDLDAEDVTREAETALRDAEDSVNEAARIGGVTLRTSREDQADEAGGENDQQARNNTDLSEDEVLLQHARITETMGRRSPEAITSPSSSRPPSRRNLTAHPPTTIISRPVHRVTALSNNPADAFASHASSLLTSVILLPIESLYLRSLAHALLSEPATRPGAAAAALGIRADVRSLGGWFGGQGGFMERLKYAGTVLLTFGLQGVVSTIVWDVGTVIALSIGRRYGWGPVVKRSRTVTIAVSRV